MFGLGRLLYVTVLLLNAVAILNEDRFIKRLIGDSSFGDSDDSVKSRTVTLIRSVRTVMRPFLITANISIIVYELLLG